MTAVIAAPLLATTFAAPATAAPEDVTLSATIYDKTLIIVTFTNNTPYMLSCDWVATGNTEPLPFFEYKSHRTVLANNSSWDDVEVGPGDYQIDWLCAPTNGGWGKEWGTEKLSSRVTADPTTITVGRAAGSLGSLGSIFGS